MAYKDNEQIVFDIFEETAPVNIAEARISLIYDEIDDCYVEAKGIADKARMILTKKITPPRQTWRLEFCGL